jgi:tetratricopeptide (TPR) repeat protein
MQNGWARFLMLSTALLLLAGCGPNLGEQNQKMDEAAVALGSKTRYDDAMSDCNRALEIAPNPRAYYLRGRAEQERPKPDASITAADYDKADADYQKALDMHPDAELEAHIRCKMADMAFSREQYTVAVEQYKLAIGQLDSDDWKAPAMYQMAVSLQRLGKFDDADAMFQQVIDGYPDTDLAQSARQHLGVRAFYVLLGQYPKASDAGAATTQAGQLGVKCQADPQPDGSCLLRAGPFTNYADAARTRNSLIVQFPGAAVSP